jgi:Skp family chaperone for outer membrane proteins
MRKILSFLFICFAAVNIMAAEVRIAAVDLDRVFREYYKSRIAEEFISQQAEAARLYLGQLNSKLETCKAEVRQLGTNALNPALDQAARQKAAEALKAAEHKLKAAEAEITLYTQEKMRDLQRMEQQKRTEILSDIQREIRRRAAAENYAFVLDTSGKSTNNQPTLLVFPEKNDISDAVIRELNRHAAKPRTENKSK